ncbi:bifunctional 3-demethylubiquinone-9 3-methyltransferase/ 2-octaprenyl-6-hydroxy phenol methylase [Photorhabdus australis subsp. thailandensis]|uniref:Bifunctional 3-demethylubiquinone-9 3-methyltransferase/ 2-octaprenyl-6-hydroxy phenol methylase n=1 Tax=Photorhabdus australis subsp. thailandensis TaxID=2805096 RepID=A0A1C0U298_9GAMM|nr:class I SAM-dependent methyltransferase [Photorhabdus australis]OCQ52021.1 bifunctional 3-demethylubiquinone-9 3-methyltransferase/ 2-octaprenyl-6-hydroxy phenol methylase [Photorhabdus australis subsp. thailandensis]
MSISDVKSMYTQYPYPSASIGDNLIYDLAGIFGLIFNDDLLNGKKVVDFGCGTGHRLIGLASFYPETQFVGVDMTENSLDVAKKLIAHHNLQNVKLVNSTIEGFNEKGQYDIAISTGVFHHMENPLNGFQAAYHALNESGVALIWLYHAIGEYNRLKEREILQIFARSISKEKYFLNVDLMNQLCNQLSRNQYGSDTASHSDESVDQIAVDVDAFLNPIVNAYHYHEIADFFRLAGFQRVRCCGLNREKQSKLLADQLSRVNDNLFLQFTDLNISDELKAVFCSMNYSQQIRVIELLWKPNGISSIGFKSAQALSLVNNWVRGEA